MLPTLLSLASRRPARLLLSLLLGGLGTTSGQAQAPAVQAAWAIGTVASPLNGSSALQASARDASGNVYVSGQFSGTVAFGSTQLTSIGDQDAFIGKIDPSGTWLWARAAGGTGSDQARYVAVDAGGAYVAGTFSGGALFGNYGLNSGSNGSGSFVARLDAGGSWLWARDAPGGLSGLSTDAAGNAYLGGLFSGSLTLGSTTLSSTGSTDAYLAKISPAGTWSWARSFGAAGVDEVTSLTTDAGGALYAAGRFSGPVTFGSISYTPPGNGTGYGFVGRLDPATGTWLWARQTDVAAVGLAADASGSLWLTSTFSNAITIGTTRLTPTSGLRYPQTELLLARLDAQGNWLWARQISTVSATRAHLALDGGGNAFLAGSLSASTRFGTVTLTATSPSRADAFVAKCDAQGSWLWARQVVGSDDEEATTLSTDAGGNVYLAGYSLGNQLALGTTTLRNYISYSTLSQNQSFLGKLDPQGNWLWARGIDNGGSSSQCNQVLPDASGNVYVSGSFNGEVSFGSTTFTAPGRGEAFLGKRDAQGNWLWVRPLGVDFVEQGTRLALDWQGNLVVAGVLTGTATFGSTTLTATGSFDAFVGKLDAQGNWLWARRAGGSNGDFANNVALDAGGNVYLAGFFNGDATFGSTTLTIGGPYALNSFVAKLDAGGNWLWAKKLGDTSADYIRALVVDDAGNATVAGHFESYSFPLGSLTLTRAGNGADVFVARLNASGTWLWANAYGGSARDVARALTLDASGNAYVTGNFVSPTLRVGSTVLTKASSFPSSDLFVAKIDAAGNTRWAQRGGDTGNDSGEGLALAADGTLYLTGYYQVGTTLGSTPLTGRGLNDAFVAQLDAQGNWLWAKSLGGPGQDSGLGLSPDASGNLYVAGSFQGPSATFDAATLSTAATGKERGFVLRLGAAALGARAPQQLPALQLYPNPARHGAYLATAGLSGRTAELRILNGLGQVVRHATLPLTASRPEQPLPLGGLPAGAYTVQLRTAAGTHTGKLLLQ